MKSTKIYKYIETENPSLSPLLKSLLEASETNSGKKNNGRRYEDSSKRFGALIYLLSGKMAYEILFANIKSSLPSITTVKRLIDNETRIFLMGQIRVSQYKKWLFERNICVAEDLTKIVECIDYNQRQNSLDGLSLSLGCNGFPLPNQFPAKNAVEIIQGIESGEKAAYMNLCMAKPQGKNHPGFCISLYPTNNRFNFNDRLNK